MNLRFGLWLLAYFVAFATASIGLGWWLRKRRKRRKPFREDVKLMRMPGEYLWEEIRKIDENDSQAFLFASVVPLTGCVLAAYAAQLFYAAAPIPAILLVITVFALSFWLSARYLGQRLLRRADHYLGFFGERYVADCLEPLKSGGWQIYHDLPFEGATGPYNIDHVAVGPNGVWVIETKCVGKREKSTNGSKEWEVEFDGAQLKWPWKEADRLGLDQALRNASSLRTWFKEQTGKDIPVHSVVTFPGWKVIERKLADVRVANPKTLPQVLTGRKQEPLNDEELDLYTRQLSARCRNVTY